MKTSEALVQQTARGAKMMFISIITMLVGIFALVISFLSYAEFSNFLVSGSILFIGSVAVTLGLNSCLKARKILDAARYGIIKLF